MSKIFRTISRALAPTPDTAEPRVHFHGGTNGAYVCENATCVSPGLDPSEG